MSVNDVVLPLQADCCALHLRPCLQAKQAHLCLWRQFGTVQTVLGQCVMLCPCGIERSGGEVKEG